MDKESLWNCPACGSKIIDVSTPYVCPTCLPEFSNSLKGTYPELTGLDSRTEKSLALYEEIMTEANLRGWNTIITSGLAIDAFFGYLTRPHKDVDLFMSFDEAQELRAFLEKRGHCVYEKESSRGEMLKIDPVDSVLSSQCHGDVHYLTSGRDEQLAVSLHGKTLRIGANAAEATQTLTFRDVQARFLKPPYILEEMRGWIDQIGLDRTKREEETAFKFRQLEFLQERQAAYWSTFQGTD